MRRFGEREGPTPSAPHGISGAFKSSSGIKKRPAGEGGASQRPRAVGRPRLEATQLSVRCALMTRSQGLNGQVPKQAPVCGSKSGGRYHCGWLDGSVQLTRHVTQLRTGDTTLSPRQDRLRSPDELWPCDRQLAGEGTEGSAAAAHALRRPIAACSAS